MSSSAWTTPMSGVKCQNINRVKIIVTETHGKMCFLTKRLETSSKYLLLL